MASLTALGVVIGVGFYVFNVYRPKKAVFPKDFMMNLVKEYSKSSSEHPLIGYYAVVTGATSGIGLEVSIFTLCAVDISLILVSFSHNTLLFVDCLPIV